MTNNSELKINGLNFSHVCTISPQLDGFQNVLEFFPQDRYENKKI